MTQTAAEPKKNTSRKVKALLAGGLVLGVGAAVTLAAWTDQEWAEGIFGAGSFNIESSVDGTTFNDHIPDTEDPEGDGAATLEFDLPAAQNLAPNDTVAAPFVLRLDASTTYDAEVKLNSSSAAGPNAENLTYGIVPVGSMAECTADASSDSPIIPTGTAMDSVTGASVINLAPGEGDAAGAGTILCFQVTASDNLQQPDENVPAEDNQTTATWQFSGTSPEA